MHATNYNLTADESNLDGKKTRRFTFGGVIDRPKIPAPKFSHELKTKARNGSNQSLDKISTTSKFNPC